MKCELQGLLFGEDVQCIFWRGGSKSWKAPATSREASKHHPPFYSHCKRAKKTSKKQLSNSLITGESTAMEPYTLPGGFTPAESENQQQSPVSKLMHTPELDNRKRSFDQQQSPDLNIQLSNTKRRKDEAMVAAKWRTSELKKAIPPAKGKAELLPTAFLKDPMRYVQNPPSHPSFLKLCGYISKNYHSEKTSNIFDFTVWNLLLWLQLQKQQLTIFQCSKYIPTRRSNQKVRILFLLNDSKF
jgi:hypothetical protein